MTASVLTLRSAVMMVWLFDYVNLAMRSATFFLQWHFLQSPTASFSNVSQTHSHSSSESRDYSTHRTIRVPAKAACTHPSLALKSSMSPSWNGQELALGFASQNWQDSPLCVPRTVLSSIETNFPGRGCKYWKTGFITTGDPGPEQTATHVRRHSPEEGNAPSFSYQ